MNEFKRWYCRIATRTMVPRTCTQFGTALDKHSITMMVPLLDGTAIMRYKVFVVDSSRRVICAAKLDCVDEQAARRRAEQMYSEHDVELWEGDRLVALFTATSSEKWGDRAVLNRRPVLPPS